MQGLSYLLSALGLISTVCALITKGEKFKTVLFFVFCGNMLVAVSYLVGGKGINGAASCCLGSVQTLIISLTRKTSRCRIGLQPFISPLSRR